MTIVNDRMFGVLKFILTVFLLWSVVACSKKEVFEIEVRATLEDRAADGSLYSSSTQSILREVHWLESVNRLRFEVEGDSSATIELHSSDELHQVSLKYVPLDQLVPRLHYDAGPTPDAFDAFNLMMAEYARNGLTLPQGGGDDKMAHFESDFEEAAPWSLEGDYQFNPNPSFKPLRIGVVNNCLASGLWEITAEDRAGELYHGWFEFPKPRYFSLVDGVNELPKGFAEDALVWSADTVEADLTRLREVVSEAPLEPVEVIDSAPGYSSQESRRKIDRGFAKIDRDGDLAAPETLADFKTHSVHLSDFIEPGKYSLERRKEFDVAFLFGAQSAAFSEVRPLTCYNRFEDEKSVASSETYLEIVIQFTGNIQIVLGNLPLSLLVQQEDFGIHGFGVGILAPSEVAERRALLLEEGPQPHFAYLVKVESNALFAVNSHESGIEQVFIRAFPFADNPHLEVTITSFERITDLVKYQFPIPNVWLDRFRNSTLRYTSPIFLTYRDDNLR